MKRLMTCLVLAAVATGCGAPESTADRPTAAAAQAEAPSAPASTGSPAPQAGETPPSPPRVVKRGASDDPRDPEQLVEIPWGLALQPSAFDVEIPKGFSITIRFTADGKVSGSSGCNTYQGHVRLDTGQLSFGPLASTSKACDEASMSIERAYLTHLATVNGFTTAGGKLTLLRGEQPVLAFMALE